MVAWSQGCGVCFMWICERSCLIDNRVMMEEFVRELNFEKAMHSIHSTASPIPSIYLYTPTHIRYTHRQHITSPCTQLGSPFRRHSCLLSSIGLAFILDTLVSCIYIYTLSLTHTHLCITHTQHQNRRDVSSISAATAAAATLRPQPAWCWCPSSWPPSDVPTQPLCITTTHASSRRSLLLPAATTSQSLRRHHQRCCCGWTPSTRNLHLPFLRAARLALGDKLSWWF